MTGSSKILALITSETGDNEIFNSDNITNIIAMRFLFSKAKIAFR